MLCSEFSMHTCCHGSYKLIPSICPFSCLHTCQFARYENQLFTSSSYQMFFHLHEVRGRGREREGGGREDGGEEGGRMEGRMEGRREGGG